MFVFLMYPKSTAYNLTSCRIWTHTVVITVDKMSKEENSESSTV
jgi:hypothetical protein